MHNLACLYQSGTGVDVSGMAGAGAAGGIGGALHAWIGGKLVKVWGGKGGGIALC